jgi:uncharacterized protein (DUF362 family)
MAMIEVAAKLHRKLRALQTNQGGWGFQTDQQAMDPNESAVIRISAPTAPIHFVIADGVIAMEGNGPLHGTHRHLGKIVLANDPVAADFACAQLMGLNPSLVWHLDRASHFLGNGSPGRIDLIAERLPQHAEPFDVLPEFAHLQIHP